MGRRLLADLQRRGADTSAVLVDSSRPTTHKQRILAGRQQLLRIDTELSTPLASATAARVCEALRTGLAEAEVVLVADYAKGMLTQESLPQECIAAARAAGIPFCADPKPVNIGLLRGASLVSPNESEALEAAGSATGPARSIRPATRSSTSSTRRRSSSRAASTASPFIPATGASTKSPPAANRARWAIRRDAATRRARLRRWRWRRGRVSSKPPNWPTRRAGWCRGSWGCMIRGRRRWWRG